MPVTIKFTTSEIAPLITESPVIVNEKAPLSAELVVIVEPVKVRSEPIVMPPSAV